MQKLACFFFWFFPFLLKFGVPVLSSSHESVSTCRPFFFYCIVFIEKWCIKVDHYSSNLCCSRVPSLFWLFFCFYKLGFSNLFFQRYHILNQVHYLPSLNFFMFSCFALHKWHHNPLFPGVIMPSPSDLTSRLPAPLMFNGLFTFTATSLNLDLPHFFIWKVQQLSN